jgi:hypothetical protein
MVQGNPAQPIAIVEVPFGIGISFKEFAKGVRRYEVTHNGSNNANDFT